VIAVLLSAAAVALAAGEPSPPLAAAPSPEPSPPSPGSPASPSPGASPSPRPTPRVAWRRSRAVGLPSAGRLVRGVQLPAEGAHFFTWDPVRERSPNRGWRRWGTDRLLRVVLRVAREHRRAHPEAPRLALGDLSRPRGGPFGRRYGGLGHLSHQNGLDVDVYYPRDDRREREAWRPGLVDRALAQDLVDRFVAAGASHVFVGPRLGLRGPREVVQPLVHHDDHLHVRLTAAP